jgi:hypothetical protein
MAQYPDRKSALRALQRHISERLERLDGEELSPGEIYLIDGLVYMSRSRESRKEQGMKLSKREESFYRLMKSIARCLDLYPVKDGWEKYRDMRARMGQRFGVPVEESQRMHGQKKTTIKIISIAESKENENYL